MKNRISKNIIIAICILLILLFIMVILLKYKVDQKGGFNNILSNSTNTTLEDEFDEDEELAIDEDEYLEGFNGDSEIDKSQMPADTETEGLRDALYTENPREVTSTIYYSTVKNILESFLKDLATMSKTKYLNKTDIYKVSNSDLRKKAYDRLSQNYIEKKEIDINNISQKLHISSDISNYNIEKMMQYAIKDNQILRFAVRLIIEDDEENSKENNFIVYLDYENQSYSIEPVGNGKIEEIKLDSEINKIEKNINNTYVYMDE